MIMILNYYFLFVSLFSFSFLTARVEADLTKNHPFVLLLKKENPVLMIYEEDPTLLVIRSEKINFSEKKCSGILKTWSAVKLNLETSAYQLPAIFTDLNELEKKSIDSCNAYPCDVKLNEKEFQSLKNSGEDKKGKYFEIIRDRVSEALKSKVRQPYETPLHVLDGFSFISKKGDYPLSNEVSASSKNELKVRALTLAKKSGYAVVRQILNVRSFESAERTHLWVESLYTDHYFDGWFEEIDFICVNENEGLFSQSILIDNDLLKSKNIFSTMMRPKLRHGIREAVIQMMKKRREEWFPGT